MYNAEFDDHDGLWDFQGIMMFRKLEQERKLKELEEKERQATDNQARKVEK